MRWLLPSGSSVRWLRPPGSHRETPRDLCLQRLHKLPYHIISYHIISYHIIYHTISYNISYQIISYIIPNHIIYHTISYHISYIIYHISYIISYHIGCRGKLDSPTASAEAGLISSGLVSAGFLGGGAITPHNVPTPHIGYIPKLLMHMKVTRI